MHFVIINYLTFLVDVNSYLMIGVLTCSGLHVIVISPGVGIVILVYDVAYGFIIKGMLGLS